MLRYKHMMVKVVQLYATQRVWTFSVVHRLFTELHTMERPIAMYHFDGCRNEVVISIVAHGTCSSVFQVAVLYRTKTI